MHGNEEIPSLLFFTTSSGILRLSEWAEEIGYQAGEESCEPFFTLTLSRLEMKTEKKYINKNLNKILRVRARDSARLRLVGRLVNDFSVSGFEKIITNPKINDFVNKMPGGMRRNSYFGDPSRQGEGGFKKVEDINHMFI